MNKLIKKSQEGFTLIEILVVIGLIAILAAVVLIAINPARQFALGRNSQRQSNVNSVLNAVGQNMVDHQGIFTCAAGTLPTTQTLMEKTGGYDVRPCIVTLYMSEIPVDPNNTVGSNTCVDTTPGDCATGTYNTGYKISQDATTKRITVCAPEAALETAIQPTPQTICVTR